MNMSREDRQRGQQKAVEVRNTRRAELAEKRQTVDKLIDWADRERLPIAAMGTALALMQAIYDDLQQLPPAGTPLDMLRKAETAKILHGIGRLELGESTSNTLTATVDPDALAQRLAKLRGAESPEHGATST